MTKYDENHTYFGHPIKAVTSFIEVVMLLICLLLVLRTLEWVLTMNVILEKVVKYSKNILKISN